MANSGDLDETPHSAASHVGLHCLLRHVCPNSYKSKYDRFVLPNLLKVLRETGLYKQCIGRADAEAPLTSTHNICFHGEVRK